MSTEAANTARFEKGLTVLTPLEGELLEALELAEYKIDCYDLYPHIEFDGQDEVVTANQVIQKAHGAEKGGE